MAVFEERTVDLRADDQLTKDLKRIADRVRRVAIRDFEVPIAVIIQSDPLAVVLGVQIEEEEIVEALVEGADEES